VRERNPRTKSWVNLHVNSQLSLHEADAVNCRNVRGRWLVTCIFRGASSWNAISAVRISQNDLPPRVCVDHEQPQQVLRSLEDGSMIDEAHLRKCTTTVISCCTITNWQMRSEYGRGVIHDHILERGTAFRERGTGFRRSGLFDN
jgi:hypothetical protein